MNGAPDQDEPIIPYLPFGLKEGLESSGSAIMFLSENGRKIKRKILRLIFRPIVGIVCSEQTQEDRTCESHGRWNIRNQSQIILRNPIIGNVFYRLHMIEKFGTGIRRIHEAYQGSMTKPTFTITENSICIILPVLQEKSDLSPDEQKVYQLLKNREMASSAIVEATGFGKSKAVAILNRLVQNGYIMVVGTGRGTKYKAE